jgi:hypothetical protein
VEIDNHGSFPNTRILTPDDGHRGWNIQHDLLKNY